MPSPILLILIRVGQVNTRLQGLAMMSEQFNKQVEINKGVFGVASRSG